MVYRASLANGKDVAVKELKMGSTDDISVNFQEFLREATLMG